MLARGKAIVAVGDPDYTGTLGWSLAWAVKHANRDTSMKVAAMRMAPPSGLRPVAGQGGSDRLPASLLRYAVRSEFNNVGAFGRNAGRRCQGDR